MGWVWVPMGTRGSCRSVTGLLRQEHPDYYTKKKDIVSNLVTSILARTADGLSRVPID
jgi:hypothetical protein